jgi:toxin YoeB
MKEILFTPNGWDDFIGWVHTDRKTFEKITLMIEEISRTPYTGKGFPEPLKYQFSGCWSRRITDVHRLIHQVTEKEIRILSCRYHYSSDPK